jgi:hypothetical protein
VLFNPGVLSHKYSPHLFHHLFAETGSFEWHCDNTLGSLSGATYSWFRKLLPMGKWRRIDHNEERYRWNIPRNLHAKNDGFDVYDMYCEITYKRVNVRSPIARIVVILPGMENILFRFGNFQKIKADGVLL